MEDSQIFDGVIDGDGEAFDAFYGGTKSTVEEVVSYFLGEDDSFAETVFKTYEEALHEIRRTGAPDIPLKSWISIQAVRQCFPVLAARRREYYDQTEMLKGMAAKVPVLQEITSDDNERLNFMVRGEVEDMPDPHRQMLTMAELDGLSFLEIAKRLSVSWINVVSRLYKARQVLADRVKEQLNLG